MTARIRYKLLLLTALLLVRVLVVPALFLNFELRREYIARYLCENRNRPERHCNGHCYLAKQLQATQEREHSEKSQEFGQYLYSTPFVGSFPTISFAAFRPADADLIPPPYVALITASTLARPFHPPRA